MSIVETPGGDSQVRLRDIPRYPSETVFAVVLVLIGSLVYTASLTAATPLAWRPVFWSQGIASMLLGLHDIDRTLRRVDS